MAPSSSNVASGDTVLATQYNNLRSDVLDPTTGHNHNATDGRTLFSVYTRFVRKSAAETVNNNTIQNDNDLFFTVGASETWHIIGVLDMRTNTTADFKMDFTAPALTASFMTATRFQAPGVASAETLTPAAITSERIFSSSEATNVIMFEAFIFTSASGTIQLRWAQNTTDVGDTTLEVGSWMSAVRVA